jgi:hypothetical protein
MDYEGSRPRISAVLIQTTLYRRVTKTARQQKLLNELRSDIEVGVSSPLAVAIGPLIFYVLPEFGLVSSDQAFEVQGDRLIRHYVRRILRLTLLSFNAPVCGVYDRGFFGGRRATFQRRFSERRFLLARNDNTTGGRRLSRYCANWSEEKGERESNCKQSDEALSHDQKPPALIGFLNHWERGRPARKS